MQLIVRYLIICMFAVLGSTSIASQDRPVQDTSRILLSSLFNTIEQEKDVFFSKETGILKGAYIDYSPTILNEPIPVILQYIRDNTPFRAIQIADVLYSIVREDSKSRLYGSIVDSNNRPLPGATISIKGSSVGVVSSVNGQYELEIDPGNWPLVVRFVGMEESKSTVDIGPGQEIMLDFVLEPSPYLREVVVTGSRSTESTILEHGTAASVIDVNAIKSDYHTGLTELLQSEHPSFYSVHQSIADATDHIDPATLRNMGPDQVLVLINGKRRHQSALVNISNTVGKGSVSTDLNTIPVSIIERIEILQDGASSQYGSDAIAGVINIILKENTDFSEVNIKSGMSILGDGATLDIGTNFGLKLNDSGGFVNLSLNHIERDAINRSERYTGPIFGNDLDRNPESLMDFYTHAGFGDGRVMSFGHAKLSASTLFFNAASDIGSDANIYANGGLSLKSGRSTGIYIFPSQLQDPVIPNPNGFSPILDTDINDHSLSFGFKKTFSRAVLDVSNTFGRNSISYNILDQETAFGPASTTEVNAGTVEYSQNTTNLDYSLGLGSTEDIKLSVGAEFRLENYNQIEGDASSYREYESRLIDVDIEDLSLFPGISPDYAFRRDRINIGLYTDLESDVSEKVRIGLSTRIESYEDFGTNLSWKVFARYNPVSTVSIKAAANTGFRAPSLHQIHYTSRSNQFISSADGVSKSNIIDHFSNESSAVLNRFNVEPLKAESSVNYNISLIVRPLDHLSLALTSYLIDVDDRIIISSRLSRGLDPTIDNVLTDLNSNFAQFFTNAVGTTTIGIEMIAKYRLLFGKQSSLDLSLSGHYNQSRVKRDADGNTILNVNPILRPVEEALFNRSDIALFESAQPASKFILGAKLTFKRFGFQTRLTRFGQISFLHPDDGLSSNWQFNEITREIESRDQSFSPKYLADLSMKVILTNVVHISLGMSNVFDVFPDRNDHSANLVNGLFPYNRNIQQFGVRGRYGFLNLYVRL